MHYYILGLLAVLASTPAWAADLGGNTGTDVWQMVWSAGPVVQGVLFILIVFSVVS